ncbi:hypothetical protein FQR65_LT04618 [Abscondita terminalis]|nr:hypothetical protein FQR65_LT04618 [Abscondita terminalis]
MLVVYLIVCPCGALQWIQYVAIADIIVDYYDVSYETVNWTNLITLLCFVICTIPSSFLLDKYGIRVSAIISGLGICIATWIKMASVSQNNFWIVILAQGILATSQTPLINIPPKMAANWFGPDEVSMACSIGLNGIQIGSALGFILPPFLIKKDSVADDLFATNVGLGILCTVAFVLILLVFTDKPPNAPSYAVINQPQKIEYIATIKSLLRNKSFLWVLLACGLNLSTYCLLQTVLNQIVLYYYSEATEDVGLMGLLMIITGIFGCVTAGYILDKFKIFRLLVLLSNFLLLITFIFFTFTLDINIVYPYIFSCMFGLFSIAYIATCYQIGIETTYPEPEAVVVGIMNASGQGLGIVGTYIYSYLFYEITTLWANVCLCLIYVITFIILIFVKFELKRSETNSNKGLQTKGV